MNKTWLVMKGEIAATLRRKLFVAMAFGLPLLLGIIALVLIVGSREETTASPDEAQLPAPAQAVEGYVDPAGLIRAVPDIATAGRLLRYETEAAAQAAMDAGQISAYFVVPSDYVASGDILYVRSTYNPLSDDAPADAIQSVLRLNLLGGDAALLARLQSPLDVTEVSLAPAGNEGPGALLRSEVITVLALIILYMGILIPSGCLVNAVLDEKKNRVMEVMLTSVSPLQMLSGKILALGLLGLAQVALYGGLLWAVIHFGGRPLNLPPGLSVPGNLLAWGAVFFLLGYGMYGGLLAGLGALVPELKDSRTPSLVLMSPMVAAYMFMMPVLANPHSLVAVASSLFPLTAPIIMIGRLSMTNVPLWQLILSVVLQLLTAMAILYLIARLFRAQTLLSGQPFSMRRYARAIAGRSA